ncbi:epimerase family protein SDR39U1 isoform X2 [Hyposmocoma kahamanoa]|uniref:epimerase family protein SDR39U1 isoform X2 n=1 Tax=Hyposmocoma kahamanoa TaxID=1477025 RepID=UPI000E6D7B30|nr:epimerase family protein SDR39U1 isoform X2 [Hyposmocoma kahamanoa]
MATSRVLIGGGTGFIGSRLGELLIRSSYTVTNVSRMPGINNISWTDLECTGLLPMTNAVVNCAGQQVMDLTKKWTPGFKQNVASSRIYTTKALAKAVNTAKHKPKVFVLITGVGAYEASPYCRYDESSAITGKDFFSTLCKDWEAAADIKPPVRLVIIRSGVVIGRWGGMIKNMFLPFWLGLGGRLGDGKQFLPWIHIDDLCRMIQFAIESKIEGIVNGVAPQVITNEEFTQAFANALRRPAILPVPEFVLNTLLNPERAMMLTQGQHVVPKRALENGFKFHYPCIDYACREVAPLFYKKPELKYE